MVQQVEAIYENGLLRPLGQLSLAESERVSLTVSTSGAGLIDTELLEYARAEVSGRQDIPSIEQVPALLSVISGSMAEAIVEERGQY